MNLQLFADESVVETPATTNIEQETPNTEEVKQEVIEGEKTPQWIPYNRFKEIVDEKNRLRQELDEAKPMVEAYQNLVKYYAENPDKAEKVRAIHEGKDEIRHTEEAEEEFIDPEIKQMRQQIAELQKFQKEYEIRQITEQLQRGIMEAENIISQKNLPITRDEIIKIMQEEYIKSPQIALQVLIGRKMDDIAKSFQQKYVSDLKKVPSGSPSFAGTTGTLAQQRPKDFNEAREMMLKDLSGK